MSNTRKFSLPIPTANLNIHAYLTISFFLCLLHPQDHYWNMHQSKDPLAMCAYAFNQWNNPDVTGLPDYSESYRTPSDSSNTFPSACGTIMGNTGVPVDVQFNPEFASPTYCGKSVGDGSGNTWGSSRTSCA